MDCPHIPELGYGEFSKRLHQKVVGQRIPISGSMELTFRCNLRCQHCYVTHCQADYADQKELSLAEIQSILDQIVDEGCLWLLLTGGEPLVRRDFLDIYTYAKRKGLLLTLFTNGTLLTPQIADYLAEWKPFSIEITLYGYTQETYERVTGIPGSHARCVRGIELIMERGLPLKLKTMLMTLNKHELRDMKAYAEGLDVPFRYDPMLNSQLNGNNTPQAFRLSPEEIVRFDMDDPQRMADLSDFVSRFRDIQIDKRYLFTCGAAIKTFHIDPHGSLSACMMSRKQRFDLRNGIFKEGWHNFLKEVRSQPPEGKYGCQQCELLALCGQCPGWAQMENSDPQQPVDYLCKVAHLRSELISDVCQKNNNQENGRISWKT